MVSIVIPCYNDKHFIAEAVASAKSQDYADKEIIIVNDGSDEETKSILEKFKDKTVKVIHQQNKGLSGARNTGIRSASGEYIMLLDSDDKFDPSFASKAIGILENDQTIGAVSCWGKKFIDNKIVGGFQPKGGDIKNFLFQNSAIGTSMLRKSVFQEVGTYDEEMRKGYEDWEFYIRLTQKYIVEIIPEYLFYYRQRKDSMRIEALNHYDLEIKKYIFHKHSELYKKHFDTTIDHLLGEIDRFRSAELKQMNKKEFLIGAQLLKPFRFLKKLFR